MRLGIWCLSPRNQLPSSLWYTHGGTRKKNYPGGPKIEPSWTDKRIGTMWHRIYSWISWSWSGVWSCDDCKSPTLAVPFAESSSLIPWYHKIDLWFCAYLSGVYYLVLVGKLVRKHPIFLSFCSKKKKEEEEQGNHSSFFSGSPAVTETLRLSENSIILYVEKSVSTALSGTVSRKSIPDTNSVFFNNNKKKTSHCNTMSCRNGRVYLVKFSLLNSLKNFKHVLPWTFWNVFNEKSPRFMFKRLNATHCKSDGFTLLSAFWNQGWTHRWQDGYFNACVNIGFYM